MYELKIKTKNGEVVNLSTTPNYTLYKVTGLTPMAQLSSSSNASADGDIVNNVRVPSRNIVLYVAMEGDIEANRIQLYKIFPIKQTVTLYFKNGTRDVQIEGVVELIECDLFSNKQVAQISLICPQPYFRSVEEFISVFSDVSSLFEFPFSIDEAGVEISAITPNIRKSIINYGDVETGVVISLYATGTVVNPILYDVQNRTHMALSLTLEANDEVIINTNTGAKSIQLISDGVTSNIMGYLVPDSSWFKIQTGDNVFTYDCDSGHEYLQVTFTTSILYGGV